MIKRNMIIWIVVLFLLIISTLSFAVEIKTAAQNSFPKFYKYKDNKLSGICVDIIKAIEQADQEIKFTGYQDFLPFKRLQIYLEKGLFDIFFGFKKTISREEKYNFIETPLYQVNYVLAVRADDKIEINSLKDLYLLGKKDIVMTVFGSATNKFLKKNNKIMIDDGARSPSKLLKKLMFKRARFAFHHDLGLKSTINNENLGEKIRIIPFSFLTFYHYAAFSKNVSIETINKVGAALAKLKENGQLDIIYNKYVSQDK